MARVEDAPALPQPVGAVLVRFLPQTATPAARVHTTASAPVDGSGSSFVIVPTPMSSTMAPLLEPVRRRLNVSLGSKSPSPRTWMLTGWESWPAGMITWSVRVM